MKQTEDYLWVEKYRPSTLDDYIGNDKLIQKAKIWIESGDIPHLLLSGKAGTGKCLDFNEKIDIEIELTNEEAIILKQFIKK